MSLYVFNFGSFDSPISLATSGAYLHNKDLHSNKYSFSCIILHGVSPGWYTLSMITFITGNKGKFKEIQSVLGDTIIMRDIDLPEIQSLDFKEVIAAKLQEASKHITTGAIMVEDSGYYFKELGRLPGVFSKFFLEELGLDGVYNLVKNFSSTKATFNTHIGYMDEKGVVTYFVASLDGEIVSPNGDGGFGYDPLFIPEGYTKRFAEISDKERNELKPRIQAAKVLKEYLLQTS